MGDDDSNNAYPESHFAMYVGALGDLSGGSLYVLRGKNPVESGIGEGGQLFEMGMAEGTTYDAEWVEVSERTMQFDSNSTHTLGAQSIADKMGYGDMKPTGVKSGLGVSTGLAGLDRVLNRDNSQLIKAWDKSKGPWRPGM
jgi:hypothetical protein